jgi:hypothetical protein
MKNIKVVYIIFLGLFLSMFIGLLGFIVSFVIVFFYFRNKNRDKKDGKIKYDIETIGGLIRTIGGGVVALGMILIFLAILDKANGDFFASLFFYYPYSLIFIPSSIVCFFSESTVDIGGEPTCATMQILWIGLFLYVGGWILQYIGTRSKRSRHDSVLKNTSASSQSLDKIVSNE